MSCDAMKVTLGEVSLDAATGRDVGRRTFPVKRFKVPVDINVVRNNGTVNATDSVLSEILLEIPESKLRGGIMRNDFIILNIIAANQWKRPIYFTSPIGELGFAQYLRKDGLAYRLVPVANKYPQQNWITESKLRELSNVIRVGMGTQIRDNNSDTLARNLLEKYAFGGASIANTYYDEENRRHLLNIREIYAEAAGNLADEGKREQAQKIIDKVDKGISSSNLPYGLVSRFGNHNQVSLQYLEACYKSGKTELAEKIRKELSNDLKQQQSYYTYMQTDKPESYGMLDVEARVASAQLQVLDAIVQRYAPNTNVAPQPKIELPNKIETAPLKLPDTPKQK